MARDLRLEVVLAAIDKATAPIKSITQSSAGLAQAMKANQDALKGMNKQQADVRAYRVANVEMTKQSRAIRDLETKSRGYTQALDQQRGVHTNLRANLKTAQGNYNKLAKAMMQGKGGSAEFQRELQKAQITLTSSRQAFERSSSSMKTYRERLRNTDDRLSRLNQQHKTTRERLGGLRTRLNEAGIGTENLGNKSRQMRTEQERLNAALDQQRQKLAAVTKQQARMAGARERYQKSQQLAGSMAASGAAGVATGVALGAPVIRFVTDYASFEEAMQGVAKQVDGARDDNGQLTATYHEIADAIKETTGHLPIATTEFAALIEAQARAGIQGKENLMAMATTAATAAVAFEIPADEVGKSLGRIASLYKIPIESINELGDTLNWLDDSAESEGRDIIESLVRMSDVADKLDYKQAAALASTFLTLGSGADTAAQAARAMVRELGVANMQSKRFQGGMSMLGMDSADVQMGMSKDAMGTILKVLEKIKELPADKQLEASTRLFGKEYGKDAGKLVNNMAELHRQLGLVNDDAGSGSMQRELDILADGLKGRKQILDNLFFNASSGLGSAMREPLIEFMTGVGALIKRLEGWVKANPELAATLVKIAAALAVLVAAGGALTIMIASILGPLAMIKYGFAMASAAAGAFSLPVLAVIAAIVLLGVAAWMLWRNWDGVVGGLKALWADMVAVAHSAFNALLTFFNGIWSEIKTAFDGGILGVSALIINWSPLGLFYKAFAGVMGYFGVDLPGKFTEFGGMLMSGLVTGIKNGLGAVKNAVTGAGDQAIGWFKDKLGIRSPSRVFAALGDDTMAGLQAGLDRSQDGPLASILKAGKAMAGAGALALGIGGAGQALAVDGRPPLQSGSAPVVVQGDTITIQLTAPAGTDSAELERMINRVMDQRERGKAARIRSALYDNE